MSSQAITRRRFLESSSKTTGSLAAGAALLSVPQRARAQSPGDQIVLALIGAGGRGAVHATGMAQLPGVEFKYVCIEEMFPLSDLRT
jgi:hypothetical protein